MRSKKMYSTNNKFPGMIAYGAALSSILWRLSGTYRQSAYYQVSQQQGACPAGLLGRNRPAARTRHTDWPALGRDARTNSPPQSNTNTPVSAASVGGW